MKFAWILAIALVLAPMLDAQVGDPDALLPMQRVLHASIDKIAPSLVSIETFGGSQRDLSLDASKAGEQHRPTTPTVKMPGFRQAQGTSTGLILSDDGWIMVSRFALNFDPSMILVTLSDGRNYPARRAGEDTSRGIALLKIDASDLPIPEFLDPDQMRVGQWAFALGRTFGRETPSVHMGIVSAKGRIFGRAIQIDAYTSPANYGGAVIDLRGRVIGLAVPLSPAGRDVGVDWYDSGIGFATTIANIPDLIERMKLGESLERAWLGVVSKQIDLGPGAEIDGIAKGSPARGIGLRAGDVILSVDQDQVRNPFHLQRLLGSHMAGDHVHLTYQRGQAEPVGLTVFLAGVPQKERDAKTKEEETFTKPWEQGRGQEKR